MTPGAYNFTVTKGCRFPSWGATTIQMIGDAGPFDLTGYTAAAQVKVQPEEDTILDLSPSVTDAANGIITLTVFTGAQTSVFPVGVYHWDLVIFTSLGEELGRFLAGQFYIVDRITNSGSQGATN